jgi:hypothetical protein
MIENLGMRFNSFCDTMKITKNVFVWAVILGTSAASAADQPLATLKLRSFADFTNALSRLMVNLAPNEAVNHGLEFSKSIGITNFTGLDTERPWEIAVWFGGGGQPPLAAIKAPVKDVTQFKENLSSEGLLRAQGREWSQLSNGLGLIVFREAGSLSEAEKSALDGWKAEAVTAPRRVVELKLNMSEPIRAMAVAGLASAKAAMTMMAQNAAGESSPNKAAIESIVGAYFEIIDTFIAGLQGYTLELDLSPDALTLETSVTAKPGTDLAGWLQAPAGQLTAQDLNWVEPDRLISGAAYVGKEPWLLKLLQKMVRLGLQVQNVDANSAQLKDLDDLMAKMLPVAAAGSLDMKDKFSFALAYRFPAASAAETYAQTKRFLTNGFQAFVGKDKMYAAASFAEKHDSVNGVQVDQLLLTINLDSPWLKMPGQKEQLQALWPDGKMEVDYAIKDDRLLAATPDRMKELLEPANGQPNRKEALKLERGTCLAGYMNLLGFIRQAFAVNPAIPEAAKDKMAKLDPRGTSLEFQLRLDNQAHSVVRVPFKLLRELGKLKDN